MPKRKKPGICAYDSCLRPVWKERELNEKHCLFHSSQYEAKKKIFIDEIEKFKQGNPSELFKMSKPGKDDTINFRGFRFPEGVSFQEHTFDQGVDFSTARFEGNVIFTQAMIKGEALFERVKTQGGMYFREAQVDGRAFFRGVRVKRNTYFREAIINGWLNLRYAMVKGNVHLQYAKIDGSVKFQNIEVGNNINFLQSNIKGDVKCDNSIVGRGVKFRNAIIGRDVVFNSAIIDGNSDLNGARINGFVDFRDAVIVGNLTLVGANIGGNGEYANLTVENLNFSHSFHAGKVSLIKAALRRLIADGMVYGGVFSFIDVNLLGKNQDECSSFGNVLLARANIVNINLSYVSFQNAFMREVNFDRITFNEAKINGKWWWHSFFTGRSSEAIHEEMVARQKRAREYKRISRRKFRGLFRLRFPVVVFNKSVGEKLWSIDRRITRPFAAAETSYRSLKHVMEQQHARGLARKMRAGELECKLQQLSNWRPEKWFMSIYRFFNGFGLKWFRAAVLWLASIIFFGLTCYQGQYFEPKRFDEDKKILVTEENRGMNWQEAIWHSLEATTVVKPHSIEILDPGIRWVEGLQRIVSPVLLLLLGQAVRNVTRD